MIYSEFKNKQLSLLGLGAMRLPTNDCGSIDVAKTREMIDFSIKSGINYFDTAYPYHNGESELVLGEILKDYPRESFYLATKYPGHQIAESYDPAEVFEHQLKKCGVEYFDFYLLHNVYENSINVYTDEKWGIIDYFREQKKNGRIKHLGFSTHAGLDTIKRFVDICGDMEFCQIQLNYLDWTLQNAKDTYDFLTERNIPVWVMEPVRGGKLAKLNESDTARLNALRPDESIAAWGFRFLQGLPNVKMVLSGMSNMEQLCDNIKTFSESKPLNEGELDAVFAVAEGLKNSIPCTACRYCCDGCPMELDIPMMLATFNDIRYSPSTNASMKIEGMPDDKKPSACINCGQCVAICPQGIDIPKHLHEFSEALKTIPSWAKISKEREEAAKRLKNLNK
ncbi:MAG: aldo/keto reductase [Clostridia bacterium]|nr:aldo/keto reductase [Clostridia bacterium]